MRRTARTLAAIVLAAATVPLVGAAPAYAETSTETATNGAYFYSAGIDKPEQSPAQPPNITGERTDGVAPGHLAVAVRAPGRADKISFLFFDLLEVGFEATVSKAIVTVPLAENGDGNMQMNPAPERVKACPADETGFASEDGANTASAPGRLCDVFEVTGTATEDGTAYQFDVTAMAASWVSEANNGMSLEPADLTTPSQAVFKPFAEASIEVEYTPAADDLAAEDFSSETFTDDSFTSDFSAGSDTGSTGFDSGSFDSGSFDSGTVSAAEDLGFGVADLPAIESELPDTAAADAETGLEPTLAGSGVRTRAASSFSESLSPTTGLLVGGVLLAALLGLLSLIMGDPNAPVAAAAGRTSRLSQALQSRDRVRGLMTRTAQS
jgi:hypothetical protein